MFSFFLLINKNGAHKKNNCIRDNTKAKQFQSTKVAIKRCTVNNLI